MFPSSSNRGYLGRGLALVLAVIVVGGTLDWGHAGGDDPDCGTVLVLHDHTAHRVTAAPTNAPQPVDHCYICHSLRAFHSSLNADGARAVVPSQSTSLPGGRIVAIGSTFDVALASRAPPSFSL